MLENTADLNCLHANYTSTGISKLRKLKLLPSGNQFLMQHPLLKERASFVIRHNPMHIADHMQEIGLCSCLPMFQLNYLDGAMIFKSLLLAALLIECAGFSRRSISTFSPSYNAKSHHLSMGLLEDILSVKTKVLDKFGGPIGFYALMLAPVYGIGLPFFGSMTDFSTLQNRAAPGVIANEYIVAPIDFTPARSERAPVFDVSAADLEKALDLIVLKSPRISEIATDESTHRREYVQRALLFRWPDVITFQAIPLEDSKSTLAIHSFSIYGAGDLGVNKNRVTTWLDELDTDMKKIDKTTKLLL